MSEELIHTAGSVETDSPEAAAPPANPPGYELIAEIGRGGMGVVYRARDIALDRDVAVKLLSDRYPADSPAAQRFLSEARITGQLQHPGIPAVQQVGTLADGQPFLAMKLIKGNTLEAILKHQPDSAAERGWLLAIFEAVCQAVGYAHANGVIHRDLKPANIMVGSYGEVQVMDWGLAKVLGEETPATADALAAEQTQAWTQFSPTPEPGSHTQAGSLVGTPAFIPPEQAVGEVERVNERSDVFGLGALLAVILTGKPPYVGETFESVRVQAVRGKLEDGFARLDGCGAEPELVVLCKKCLAFEPADRPADAGTVAAAVAGLRAAADERARRAELDKVRVEAEKAASGARALERRKRRRLALAAAAVLAAEVFGGLSAVLAVQRRANADLAAKNYELASSSAKVQERFDLALKAIALFHTGVSEDILLKNAEFEGLRTKLLKEAASFYADLAKRLAGHTDAKSQQALAAAYFQLGELTDKIGDQKEALAAHRKVLALRRELAAAKGAGAETRLDVARSLATVGELLRETSDNARALAAHEEQRELAQRLEAEHPTDAVRSIVAASHYNIGRVLYEAGKPEEALASYHKALAIGQKLADTNLAVTQFQRELAATHSDIGFLLAHTGRQEEGLKYLEERLQLLKAKHGSVHPATLAALDGVALGYLAVAAQQAWLGQEQEWAATCERGQSLARDTKIATLADRVAKLCSLRPSNDKNEPSRAPSCPACGEFGQGQSIPGLVPDGPGHGRIPQRPLRRSRRRAHRRDGGRQVRTPHCRNIGLLPCPEPIPSREARRGEAAGDPGRSENEDATQGCQEPPGRRRRPRRPHLVAGLSGSERRDQVRGEKQSRRRAPDAEQSQGGEDGSRVEMTDRSGQRRQVDDERKLRLKIPYQLVIHRHQLATLALGQSHV